MAFTCGFFDSLSGDRKYNAKQISEIFDGVIRDGVYMSIGTRFLVEQGTGMQITVNTGRAWFNHTWTLNDAKFPLTVELADLILDRIDAVVLEVDSSLETRKNQFKIIKGTPASNPQKPQMVNTEFIHQYALAYIRVKKGATSITTSDIEINVGKSDCPFVTSILEAADISTLYAQWESQFRDWENQEKAGFEEWLVTTQTQFTEWETKQKEGFDTWFNEIKDQLSEDAAGNLQLQLDEKGIQIYTHSKEGIVHNFVGNGPNGRALMTADVVAGDTFAVNGELVTAYMGADNAVDVMAGNAYSGKWVTFVFENSVLNFKGGGGGKVTVSGLSAAAIKTGVTVVVKQGAKTIQTVDGTFTSDATAYAGNILSGAVAYTKGQRIVGNIPVRTNTYEALYHGQDPNRGSYGLLGNNVWVVPAVGYYPNFDVNKSRIDIHGPTLARTAGLTPNKLPAGVTVLGVTGNLVWQNLLPQVFVGQNGATVDPNILGSVSVGRGYIEGRGVYVAGWGNQDTAIFTKPIETNVFASVEITIGEMIGAEANTNLMIGITSQVNPNVQWNEGFIHGTHYVTTIRQGNIYKCDLPMHQYAYVRISWTSAHGFIAQTRLIKR